MTQTSKITVQPKKIIVKEVEWSLEEIQQLKDLYAGRPFIALPKRDIRNSALLQKAMECDVVQNIHVQDGEEATLHLAQVGYDLVASL